MNKYSAIQEKDLKVGDLVAFMIEWQDTLYIIGLITSISSEGEAKLYRVFWTDRPDLQIEYDYYDAMTFRRIFLEYADS